MNLSYSLSPMIRLASLLSCAMGWALLFSGAAYSDEGTFEADHRRQKTSAQLVRCPDGHKALKDIPIWYGRPSFKVRPEAEWTEADKKFAKQEAAKEVILGGCITFPQDPRFQVTCMKCNYHYEVFSVPDEDGHWTKSGASFSDFTTTFSAVTLTLPLPQGASRYISVSLSEGKVHREFISATVPLSRKEKLLGDLRLWIASNHFDNRLLKIDLPDTVAVPRSPFDEPVTKSVAQPPEFKQSIEDGRATFIVLVKTYAQQGTVDLLFSLQRDQEK